MPRSSRQEPLTGWEATLHGTLGLGNGVVIVFVVVPVGGN